jgi:hypothetical protein
MKTITNISLAALSFFLILGCQNTPQSYQQYATPANVRVATALVCSSTLTFAVNPSDQAQVANYIYSIANGVETLTTGKVPTPAELQATINMFSPGSGSKWVTLGTSIGSIYGGIYSQINGNGKLAIDYLNAIAAGCDDAAVAFIPKTSSPTPIPIATSP